jgi:hypothetical protein
MKSRTFALLVISSACQSPTQLVVLVDSDLEVPAELAAVQAIVTDDAGEPAGAEFFDLGRYGVPMSFGVEGGDLSSERIRITIQGLTARDELLVERTAALEFIKGEKRLLPMFLARSCAGRTCGESQTCTEDGCASIFVDVESLQEIEPGDERTHPRPKTDSGADTGTMDTGADGGGDTGSPDVGPDADSGQPDAIVPGDAGLTTCTSNAECTGPSICVEPNGFDCAGGNSCVCRSSCPPLSSTTICPPEEECYFRPNGDGVCLDRSLSTAANFRAPCTSPSECDAYENYRCRQLADTFPGECTTLCLDSSYCDLRLPGTFCDLSAFGGQPYGECLEPPQPITDVGYPCTTDNECQSGRCITALGACSASCTGLTACPAQSLCGVSLDGTDAWCVASCSNDADCSVNPNFVCREEYGFDPGGLCFYRCSDMYPCDPGLVCDPASGHCI